MFLVSGGAFVRAAFVKPEHFIVIRDAEEGAELPALATWIGNQLLIAKLGIDSGRKRQARLPRQADVPIPPERCGTDRGLFPRAEAGQPLACRPPPGPLPAQDR